MKEFLGKPIVFESMPETEQQWSAQSLPESPRPVNIMFFPNGMAAVFSQYGEQMGKYQGAGKHPEVIAAPKADGYDWQDLRVDGLPLRPEQFVDNLGRPMAVYEAEVAADIAKWSGESE